MYGDGLWGNDTNGTPHHSGLLPDSSPHRRNLFDFLRFNLRPVDASRPLLPQPCRRNFSLFTGRTSLPTVDIAPAQDVERHATAPPTEAEVAAAMAAALQQASRNAVDNPMSQGQPAAGVQGSQVVTQGPLMQIAQEQHSLADTGEPVFAIGCCGFVFNLARHRSQST
ncbi:hypothetical protein AZE42_11128 [Rhizopogon vesiculosus]|uniref:Uncharacterized protein n=1 Tax=Rhizopogon vesiculosus TaxID=180088 RepID=A0A1J8QKJ8_9AGAM|nr:hypothetical protein AZE42_11128 [Rhizopogon vesiculosus]